MGDELFKDDSDGEDLSFKVNDHYSKKYELWRTKEELSKMKSKYGSEALADSESGSTEDDESEEELDIDFDEEFMKTYSLLKSRDKRIYDPNFVAFKDRETLPAPRQKKSKKQSGLTVKQAEFRQALAEQMEDAPDVDTFNQNGNYYEQLEATKKAFIQAAKNVDDSDDFIVLKEKTQRDEAEKEEDYRSWLKDQTNSIARSKEMEWLKEHWNRENIDEEEKFLRDYILNRKYRSNEGGFDPTTIDANFSAEEEELEKADEFERCYNFRFEEPDKEFIKSYPRTIESTLRKEDNRRKEKREKYRQRKRQEAIRFADEVNRMRALKRKEVQQRLEQIKTIAGDVSIPIEENDIEDDFDPDSYDKKMDELFDERYYATEEDKKPPIEIEDECLQVDLAADLKKVDKIEEALKLSRRKRKKEKWKQQNKKLGDDGDDFGLGYEDVVAGIPCKFKYRQVLPNDFGLSTDEILAAEDKELNRWVSLRKMVQYRSEHEEKFDKQAFEKKRNDRKKKMRILTSVFQPKSENNETAADELVEEVTSSHAQNDSCEISDERLKAFGLNPKKFRRKKKYTKAE